MNAGRKAVSGMARMGAAMGLISSNSQRKLAIRIPRGIAIAAHQKNACAIRHQLSITLPRRSYSVHSLPNARITPIGFGSENGGRISQWVRPSQSRIMTLQLRNARAILARGEISFRMLNKLPMRQHVSSLDSRKPKCRSADAYR